MSTEQLNVDEIFFRVLDLTSEDDQQRYLQEVCGANVLMIDRVNKLLEAQRRASGFMEKPPLEIDITEVSDPGPRESDLIGPYRLREKLGVGGMGVVWAAERREPIKQKVAIKVIKPGMDSEQVLARFEAEREALAMMDHPSIARVLDAGTTERGRPYFVMELIRGLPITQYCDAQRLGVSERLELFCQVCRAAHHAHQKGIIHRDIKPSNVLVTEHDGTPVPKVIDFGVAKALHHSLTDRSLYSGVFQAIGTLAYMSPEQAGFSAGDIDIRADVYGLGVLLYELLTGHTPLEKETLQSAGLGEAFRLIREVEPVKPSNRVTTLGEESSGISQSRRCSAAGLERAIRGDLDWVVMKSLDKDRRRRFASANEFADDIQNYLENRAVQARPPSVAYAVQKFVRRHRVGVGFTLAVSVALLAGTAVGIYAAMNAFDARKNAVDSASALERTVLRQANSHLSAKSFEDAETRYRDLLSVHEQSGGLQGVSVAEVRLGLTQAIAGQPGRLAEATEYYLSMIESEPRDATSAKLRSILGHQLADSCGKQAYEIVRKIHVERARVEHAAELNRLATQIRANHPVWAMSSLLIRYHFADGSDIDPEVVRASNLNGNAVNACLVAALEAERQNNPGVAKDWLWACDGKPPWGELALWREYATKEVGAEDVYGPREPTLRIEVFSRMIRRHPGNSWLLQRRACWYAKSGDWESSLGDLEDAMQLAPLVWRHREYYLLNLLRLGQTERFWKEIAVALDSVSQPQRLGAKVDAMILALLLEDAACPLDEIQRRLDSMSGSFPDLCRAMLTFRQGRYDESIERLEGAQPTGNVKDTILRYVFLAMAYQRVGRVDEAKETLGMARDLKKRRIDIETESEFKFQDRVWVQAMLNIVLREAEPMVGLSPAQAGLDDLDR